MCSTGSRSPASRRPSSTCITSPISSKTHVKNRDGKRPSILVSDERDVLLDTGGGVTKALPLLGAGPFFIHNADTVWSEGPRPRSPRMLNAWDPEKMDCLLLLAPTQDEHRLISKGTFPMAPDGRLNRKEKGEVVPFAFAGVSLCDARLFENAPDGRFSLNVLWDRALIKGRLYGIELDGHWMHVGTPAALAEAETLFEREGA